MRSLCGIHPFGIQEIRTLAVIHRHAPICTNTHSIDQERVPYDLLGYNVGVTVIVIPTNTDGHDGAIDVDECAYLGHGPHYDQCSDRFAQ